MRWRDYIKLYEEMSYDEAMRVFQRYDAPVQQGLTLAELKLVYRDLAKEYHPDIGTRKNLAAMQRINAAYDVLKQGPPPETPGYDTSGFQWQSTTQQRYEERQRAQQPEEDRYPVWAQAGHSGGMPESGRIYRNDYTDVNFIKKRMWELSGQSKFAYTIWGYDGAFFRGCVTVYGNKNIYHDMAEAMIDWQTKGANPYQCRAVFVTKGRGKDITLIYADGAFYDGKQYASIEIEHKSFNSNPGNDQQFVRDLPRFLDKLKSEREDLDSET